MAAADVAAANVGGPAWLAGTFAAVMLLTAGYCASRLVAARRWRRPTEFDVDVMHAVMGVALAGMLVPRLSLLRHGSWEIIFAGAVGWFGWQIIGAYRGRPANNHPSATGQQPANGRRASPVGHWPAHHVPHLLACGAMLYMYLAAGPASSGTGVPGMSAGGPSAGAAHSPGLALPLALALLGYVVWTTDRLTALPPVAALAGRVQAAPLTAPMPARPPMSPRLAACCEIAMGLTMGYMLIQML